MMLTSRIFTAQEAYYIGMIDRVVEDEKLMDEARQLTEELASGATQAYGSVKKLLNLSFSNDRRNLDFTVPSGIPNRSEICWWERSSIKAS